MEPPRNTPRFLALGPFRIPLLRGDRSIDFHAADRIFDEVAPAVREKYGVEIGDAVGCYIFADSPSGSSRIHPYYVGQSCRQTLATRVFQRSDKVAKYAEILRDSTYVKAAPVLFLFPLLTPTGRLARLGSNADLIDRAEYTLIGLARRANEYLWNSKHKVGMDAFRIDGVDRVDGRTHKGATAVRRMLFT
jgi:hypothetical protein